MSKVAASLQISNAEIEKINKNYNVNFFVLQTRFNQRLSNQDFSLDEDGDDEMERTSK